MDPLERLDLKGDTTFILGLEAQRGFDLFFYTPEDLVYKIVLHMQILRN